VHVQPVMRMAVVPWAELAPPSARLTAFSALLPYAKKLPATVIHTASHFLSNAFAS
jgi:hypothetical protein